MPDAPYVHGTAPPEQKRLTTLNDLLNAAAVRELALAGGERILDVGSGLGQLTRAMARAAGSAALGVERSDAQIAEAQDQAAAAGEGHLAEFRRGDAANLPLNADERGAFDLVHTRFLLEHVPAPLAVVREMVTAARPGGRIVLQDDDHGVLRLHPVPPGMRELWEAYCRVYDRLGCDPYIGRRLVSLLHEAGAKPTRNHWLWFGSCAGHEHFDLYAENLIGVVMTARERILAERLIDAPAFDNTIAQVREWTTRPDAAIWFSVCWAEGVKPA